jgi:hypothetical protein
MHHLGEVLHQLVHKQQELHQVEEERQQVEEVQFLVVVALLQHRKDHSLLNQ